ncbi:MAG: rhodanese-like domain-containing protein [candidate division KSB1 bacterium]
MKQMSVTELRDRRKAGEKIILLDVREQNEVDYCKIAGSIHIPMNQVPMRMNELNPQDVIVVHCHVGGRSMQVCGFLESKGYADVSNLHGGIKEWSRQIDPTVPSY